MQFVNYIYPIVINLSGRHHVFRDQLLTTAFNQVTLFNEAAKTTQASRIYIADAGLATLREYLRFAAEPSRKCLSPRQHGIAETILAETGGMLNAWLNKK